MLTDFSTYLNADTHLILDETVLEEGQLDNTGMLHCLLFLLFVFESQISSE